MTALRGSIWLHHFPFFVEPSALSILKGNEPAAAASLNVEVSGNWEDRQSDYSVEYRYTITLQECMMRLWRENSITASYIPAVLSYTGIPLNNLS